jgi:hypothetical protein
MWARALEGEDRDRDALPHAEMAAELLTKGSSADAKRLDSEAQQVLHAIRSKLL